MVLPGKVYGATGKSLWCVMEKSMVLKPGKPHKIGLFRVSKSGGKSRKINQVLNQAINQGTTPQAAVCG
ncbi:hypothetical protein D5282_26540 [bacterium 1xD8-48]|uniref:Uncharacterized protein n=2 Tax=Bacillota TaxID=1239 RepID=A0A4Q1ZWD9_9LACO|nr:hypothetical protein [bacterium c-19]NBJ84081.1 hypothetical protein [bacterium 1XD42-76]NBJ95677.1 hypothetical protein [Parablautia muri]NBK00684.1 hypothetical protein [bacterium 1xD8-48]NBK07353.1 hypothetical protein [bacterium 1XD42-94]NBK94451.1 hypothetical protein [bacterium 1XD21-13]RXV60431.1 hypothetical protein D6C19_11700 [Ligilactobacillus murinus]